MPTGFHSHTQLPTAGCKLAIKLFRSLAMPESLFLQLTCLRVHESNLLEARVIITTYNQHVRLLSPEPWLVGTTKDYSGVGADIVMESISLTTRGSVLTLSCLLYDEELLPYPAAAAQYNARRSDDRDKPESECW